MSSITMKDLSERIDVMKIADTAYSGWNGKQRRRRSVEQWLIKLLPIGLVLVTLIFYGLSAPHTAHILSLITPSFGVAQFAPLGWELGILIVAALREAGWKARMTTGLLYTLLIMSIIINVAGALVAVIELGSSANLSSDTLTQLLGRFWDLPAFYQIVLLLVVPIGAVIPIIGKMAGEGVVKLAMGRVQLENKSDESRWLSERNAAVYSALFQEAIKVGAGAATAGAWSQAVVRQLYREVEPVKSETRTLTAAVGQDFALSTQTAGTVAELSETNKLDTENPLLAKRAIGFSIKDQNGSLSDQQSEPRVRRADVLRWLRHNPDVLKFTDRDIARRYMLAVYGLDSDSCYKTVQRMRKEMSDKE